jgi:hypothetical protein
MSITNGYATLEEFKQWATSRGETASTAADDDAVIEDIIEQASRYIDGMAGRRFYADAADVTRTYTAEDDTLVFIDDLSATPTSLKVDYDGDRTYATTVASTDYDLLPENAAANGQPYTMLEMRWSATDYFPDERKGVQVVGKWGFPSVPTDIKNACLMIALNVYQGRRGQVNNAGAISVTAAGVVIRPSDVPDLASQIIAKHRRVI